MLYRINWYLSNWPYSLTAKRIEQRIYNIYVYEKGMQSSYKVQYDSTLLLLHIVYRWHDNVQRIYKTSGP